MIHLYNEPQVVIGVVDRTKEENSEKRKDQCLLDALSQKPSEATFRLSLNIFKTLGKIICNNNRDSFVVYENSNHHLLIQN